MIYVLVLLAFLGIPLAHADATDDHFLAALDRHGITYFSRDNAIFAGHLVCQKIGEGMDRNQLAQAIADQTALDNYRAGFFVGISIAAYCPWLHR